MPTMSLFVRMYPEQISLSTTIPVKEVTNTRKAVSTVVEHNAMLIYRVGSNGFG